MTASAHPTEVVQPREDPPSSDETTTRMGRRRAAGTASDAPQHSDSDPQSPPSDPPEPVGGTAESADATPTRKEPKVRKQPPPGVPIPTIHNFRGVWYHVVRRALNQLDQVPKVTKSDLRRWEATQAVKQRDERIAYLSQWLFFAAHHMRLKIGVFNLKGGAGKTPVAAYLASIISSVSGAATWLLPATRNPGNTASMAGVNPEHTISLRRLGERLEQFPTYSQAVAVTRRNDYMVLTVANDAVTPVDDKFSYRRLHGIINTLDPSSQVIVLDTGNGSAQGAELAAAKVCDLMIFSCATAKPETLIQDGLGATMDSYATDRDLRSKGKVTKALVVINGLLPEVRIRKGRIIKRERVVHPAQTAGDYRDYAKFRINSYNTVVGSRDFEGTVMGVPWDDHMSGTNGVTVVNLDAISRETFLAYLEIWYKIYTQVAEERGFDLHSLVEADMADMAMQRTGGMSLRAGTPVHHSQSAVGTPPQQS